MRPSSWMSSNVGGEIRDQVVRVRIQAHHNGIGQKLGDLVIRALGIEKALVDAGREVQAEAADGFCGAENGAPNAGIIKLHQGAVTLLDLNYAVLNCHVEGL